MAEKMVVSFPGNLKVNANIGDFTIGTDQPEKAGGDNSAPSPFTLFAASIATCAGYFALKFCKTREIDTEGLEITLRYGWDKVMKKFPKMTIELRLPAEFPDKYRGAILKAVDQCVVKKHILDPPEFDIQLL